MNIERMEELIRLIETVKPQHYDQGSWMKMPIESKVETTPIRDPYADEMIPVVENFCGTSACVLGHAALHQRFMDLGLRVKVARAYNNFTYATVIFINPETDAVYEEDDAGQEFFDLGYEVASTIFGGGEDAWYRDNEPLGFYTFYADYAGQKVTPQIVARALRAVIATYGQNVKDYREQNLTPHWETSDA